MFDLYKYTAKEATWNSVLCKDVTATTYVENINTTDLTDWRGCFSLYMEARQIGRGGEVVVISHPHLSTR